jgi:ribosomal protein S19
MKNIVISEGMLGLKIGEFIFSRKFGKIHKKKELKSKGK